MNELAFLSATQMAELIRRKKVSPVELVGAHLERIEELNPRLNAIVSLDHKRAQAEAQAAEAAILRGDAVGSLHGVPVTIKSSIDVVGLCSECGSKLRAGYVATADAPVVTRLRRAGAIILGTTNVPEMLMAYETNNVLYGRTNNPWAIDRTPGGSSGGEAAAIAAGCSAGGVGSDGGGSIRVPAHFSGICGLKPTPGRIPATGHFPASVGPFAHLGVLGPMARTVSDLEIFLRVMADPNSRDASTTPVELNAVREAETLRIPVGYFEDDGRTPVTPETRATVGQAAEALRQQGLEVAPFRPEGLEQARQAWWALFGLAGGMLLQPLVAGREAELGPALREFIGFVRAGPPLKAEQLLDALIERDVLRERLLGEMQRYPVLLCPVSTGPAFRHGEIGWSAEGHAASYLDTMSYSQWFNLLGNPAATVPLGRSPEGLPIGVQIVGRPWEETTVLAIAARIEQICGGWQKPPLDR